MRTTSIFSPSWNRSESYGRIAHELRDHLLGAGYRVNQLSKGEQIAPIRLAFGGFVLGYPTNHYLYEPFLRDGARVGITMFESTRIPDEWIAPLNRCDAVVVPARFLVDVFRDAGVTVPLHVVPLGVSEAFCSASESERKIGNTLTFLTIGDRGRRKGWWDAIQAFLRAFGDDMRYRLIIKARDLPFTLNNPNIDVISDDYSDEEMAALYRRCHVMLFPTHGEGFGLPPREFAATGGLAITTGWGGTADDIENYALRIPYTMETAWPDHQDWRGQLGQWAAPDVEVLAALMQHVADDYDAYRDFRVQAAEFVRANYRWDRFGREAQVIYEQIVEVKNANRTRRDDQEPAEAPA